jgi:hypothetical protein
MRCNIVRLNWSLSLTYYGPLSATPKSTGWSAGGKALSACRRRFCLARFHIPAHASAARCDRTTERKRREHDHFNLGRHQALCFLQLGYQPKDEAVEFHVRHGQCRLAARGRGTDDSRALELLYNLYEARILG